MGTCIKRWVISLLFWALFAGLLSACSTEDTGSYQTPDDFEHATLGIMTGSSYDPLARARFPQAQRRYYSLMTDLILAAEQGKIDGFISEKPYCIAAIWEGRNLSLVEEPLKYTDVGFIFQKGTDSPLREQMNAFVLRSRENGLLDELNQKWFGPAEPTEHPEYDSLTGENGTIRLAMAPDLKPVIYYKNNCLSGYEMDLLVRFAEEYGYKLDVSLMTFDAILPGIAAGKYDIGVGGVNITEERAQSVDFSESHLVVDVVIVKGGQPQGEVQDFWAGLKESFEKTFIREQRWQMILQGMGVTLLIGLSAVVIGTFWGFGLYLLSRSRLRPLRTAAAGAAKVYCRIVAGTPAVVILMIFFYVVFGSVRDISGIPVAIIGFSLTFGSFVYSHMRVAVGSVDFGQTEAAYALGYPPQAAFFRIVLPQAMTIFLPTYSSQMVELIKATAVVGYIAVNDLTKMGDIIRSNTYEAFFPLIATAVIYFFLTWALTLLLGLIRRCFEPKGRSEADILRGITRSYPEQDR